MDNENRKEILSKLFTIRAGLSVINLQKDKLDKDEQDLKRIDGNLKSKQNKCKYEQRTISSLQNDISANEHRISDEIDKFPGTVSADISVNFEESMLCFLGLLLLPALVVSAVWALFRYLWHDSLDHEIPYLDLLLHWGIVFVGFALIIALLIWIFSAVKDIISDVNKKKENMQAAQKNILNAKAQVKEHREEAALLSSEIEKIKVIRDSTAEKNEKRKQEILPPTRSMHKTLVKTYESFLSPRDWKHIDLLIYYIDTGRADSIKEALQQVDMQMRMNTLVETISVASNAICTTIKTSINTLRQDLDRNFQALAFQLKQQNEVLGTIKTEVGTMRSEVDSKLESISSNQSMQNALLTKINVSSEELVKQADSITSGLSAIDESIRNIDTSSPSASDIARAIKNS